MPTPDSRFATTRALDVGQRSNGVRDRRSSRAGALRGRSTSSSSLRRAGDASPRKKCCWSPNSVPAVSAAKTPGIGDPDVLARMITVYTDVGTFQRFLSIPGSNDVARAGRRPRPHHPGPRLRRPRRPVLARDRSRPPHGLTSPIAEGLGRRWSPEWARFFVTRGPMSEWRCIRGGSWAAPGGLSPPMTRRRSARRAGTLPRG
jgi:hypothetical protein